MKDERLSREIGRKTKKEVSERRTFSLLEYVLKMRWNKPVRSEKYDRDFQIL